MSTNYSNLVSSVMSAGTQAAAAGDQLTQKAQQTGQIANDTLKQTIDSVFQQQLAIEQEGQLNQQAAQQVQQAVNNDGNVKAFQVGQNALAPDLSDAVAQFHREYQQYSQDQGGILNQFLLGFTGHDFAGERLQSRAMALNSLTNGLATLANNANVDTQFAKNIAETQIAAPKAALDAKVKAAEAYQNAVPALDKTLGASERSAQMQAAGAQDKFSALREMYMTALEGNRIARENQNADLQRQALQLEVQQRQMVVQQLTRNDDYMNSLATQSRIPRTILDKMPESEIQKVADMSLGLPLVNNLADIKDVQAAAKIASYTDQNPYSKATTQAVANALIGYQGTRAAIEQQAMSVGKPSKEIAAKQNFNLLNDINTEFLDNVPIQLPGQEQPAPLTQTMASWFLHPTTSGSPGGAFWKSLEANNYASSNTPGAPIAKRIISDIQTNPKLIKGGIDVNYFHSIGASPQAVFDFYNFMRQQVALSTPYQTFGLQPPQAKFKIPMASQTVGFLGEINPDKSWHSFDTPDDVEKAYVTLEARERAAKLAVEMQNNIVVNSALGPGG